MRRMESNSKSILAEFQMIDRASIKSEDQPTDTSAVHVCLESVFLTFLKSPVTFEAIYKKLRAVKW